MDGVLRTNDEKKEFMKAKVTIVVCYQKNTGDILATCLASLARHTKDVPYKVVVLTRGDRKSTRLNSSHT